MEKKIFYTFQYKTYLHPYFPSKNFFNKMENVKAAIEEAANDYFMMYENTNRPGLNPDICFLNTTKWVSDTKMEQEIFLNDGIRKECRVRRIYSIEECSFED